MTTINMTKKEAIALAKQSVSTLYKFGDGWAYSIYIKSFNAWTDTYPTDYWLASFNRRRTLIRCAKSFLYPDYEENYSVDYNGGKWTDWV